jgi:multidrug resistance efflux pump
MGEQQAQQQMQAQAQQQAEVEQAKQQGAAEAMAAAPPAAAAPARDVTTELQKLADLHKSGVLTDEEFTAAKKKLLG